MKCYFSLILFNKGWISPTFILMMDKYDRFLGEFYTSRGACRQSRIHNIVKPMGQNSSYRQNMNILGLTTC
jgi:hypothetical protein